MRKKKHVRKSPIDRSQEWKISGRPKEKESSEETRSTVRHFQLFDAILSGNNGYYHLAHEYINTMGISCFFDIRFMKKPQKHIEYSVLNFWVSTIT